MKRALAHPFWQAVGLLVGAYLIFKYGIGYLLPLLGIHSAPVPGSVIIQYTLTALAGILLYVSADSERWRRFKEPIQHTLVEPHLRAVRGTLLILVPLLVGYLTYRNVKPSFGAPASLRSIHPAPPNQITFRGRSIQLAGLENSLRRTGSLEAHVERGRAIYTQNCVPCHGDRLDGQGHFAHAFTPVPADFTSGGTISQLQESYVFWRIATGGPGLPQEGTPWNSAMPAWEPILEEDEIWAVIIFLYEQTGSTPRTWEEATEGGEF